MKRQKEIGNLIRNVQQNICDNCKRWNGEFTDDDRYVCKYNKDNKGLHSGLCINHPEDFKCKYFKRSAYTTSRFKCKNYYVGNCKNGIRTTKEIKWVKGKFKTIDIKVEEIYE